MKWHLIGEAPVMERTQRSFADLEYENKKQKTWREQFFDRMEVLIPWEKLLEKIMLDYPTTGRVRRPYPLGKYWKASNMSSERSCLPVLARLLKSSG